MLVTVILAALVLISSALLVWQFIAALRFPLHKATAAETFSPEITLLKPLKGFNEHTKECLRSWLAQKYGGHVQVLFGVADEDDPVCYLVRELLKEFPNADAELVITGAPLGPNAKVSTLICLHKGCLAKAAKEMKPSSPSRPSRDTQLIVISDADVRVPENFLANAVAPLRDSGVGLVNCFYQLANPTTLAMKWEAVAVNADFWSQVLQSNTIEPQDFALGAVMITRREVLERIGGFEPLLDYLADDYQLGHRIAATGSRIALSPIVVECWDKPMSFGAVWNHQLRWARTIRVSQPLPYFFSILSNPILWATLLALLGNLGGFPLVPDSVLYSHTFSPRAQNLLAPIHVPWVSVIFITVLVARVLIAGALQQRLTRRTGTLKYWWLVPAKDFLQFVIWAASFVGNTIEWSGKRFRLARGGKLAPK